MVSSPENPALNIANRKELRGSLQNLSSFFANLHQMHLEQLTETMARTDLDSVFKGVLINHYKQDAAVSGQLFNNYRVSGHTDDGHSFEFTHQEPGYKEEMSINGCVVNDY